MSLSGRPQGVTLLEFLAAVLMLVLFISFYVEWNSFRASERLRDRLVMQIDEVTKAAHDYRTNRLPYVRILTISQLRGAWPSSMEELQSATLSPLFQSALPGGIWHTRIDQDCQPFDPTSVSDYCLKLRLEVSVDSAYADMLDFVGGTEEEKPYERHSWRQVLRDQNAADCASNEVIANTFPAGCDVLEILLLPSPRSLYHRTDSAGYQAQRRINKEEFKDLLEARNYDLSDARLIFVEGDIEIYDTLQTNVLEAGQVMRCCLVDEEEDYKVTAQWPTPETSNPVKQVHTSGLSEEGRRIAHTGMGYLGLGDAFVGSDGLYTRVLKLGGDAGTHVHYPGAVTNDDLTRSESSYFSYVRLQNVRITRGLPAVNHCGADNASSFNLIQGRLIGWKPVDLEGATRYEDFQKNLEDSGALQEFTGDHLPNIHRVLNGWNRPVPKNEQHPGIYEPFTCSSTPSSSIWSGPAWLHFSNKGLLKLPRNLPGADASVRPWGGQYSHQPDASADDPRPFGTRGLMGGLQRRSDARIKREIRPLPANQAALSAIRSYSYDKAGVRQMGFFAQEVQRYYPRLVREGEDGYLRLRYEGMVPVLWGQVGGLVEREEKQWATVQDWFARMEARLDGEKSH